MMGQLYVWYLNQLDDYNAVADRMLEQDTQKLNERITITGASISTGNALSVTVVNGGGTTAHIVSLWVIDESVTPSTHTRTDVNVYVARGGTGTVNGTATYGNVITLRLVTELGNTVTYRIAPASRVANLRMTLAASPPTVIGTHDVGITLLIFNNNTVYDALYNLRMTTTMVNTRNYTDIAYSYTGSGESVTLTLPTTTTLSSLRSGETAVFNWKYTVTLATPAQNFTFYGRYTGASYYASSRAEVVTPFGRGNQTSLASIAGSVRMIYGSFQWASRSGFQTSGFTWNSNWQASRNTYLVLRVDFTNDGSQSFTLASNSAIYMQRLETSGFQPFFIVKQSGGTISTYDNSVVLLANAANTVTVYFAVDTAGDNPTNNRQKLDNAGTYLAILGIFGTMGTTPYAQSIPFQAFIAI